MGGTKNADNRWWPALTITLIYATVGAGWILVSDQLLTLIVRDAETITRMQTVKGWFYVLATAALLFWLIRRQLNAIHEKESYNRVLFEESTIGLVLSRMSGELVDINPAYSRIIGRSIEECLNLTYRDITPEKYAEDDLRQLQILEKTGRYGPYEKEYIHKDGHQVSVRLSGMMLEKDGEHFIWSSAEDISERKQAEERVIASERELSGIVNSLQEVYYRADKEGNITRVSPSIKKMFGYNPEELIGKQLADLYVNPTGRERFFQKLRDSHGELFGYEEEVWNKKRVAVWASVNAHYIYDDNGNVSGVEGTLRDVSNKKKREMDLQRANRALQALSRCNELLMRSEIEADLLYGICRIIVEVAGYRLAWVGFAEHDAEKSINPMAQVGYEDGYLDTLKLTWADTELGKGPTGTAIRTGRASVIRNIMQDPRYAPWRESAQKRGYRSSISLPLNDKEQTFGALNIYADEEDAFDEEEMRLLQELADDLAYGITSLRSHKERHQLNRQLQQSQKMEAIGQLTGGIAHDFNNILASILGFTGLALQRFVKDDQPKLREYLNEVTHAGERARGLVSQMLAFGRKGSGKASLLQIAPMINEVTKMLQVTLPSTIQISSHTAADLPKVMIDPVQLHQVLMNICINARDAIGDKGRIDIRVERENIVQGASMAGVPRNICAACHHEIDEGDYVVLSIQDSGSGISDDTLSRIFEPFFTTKEVGKGSGLGLSVVHGIVHEHGGHILVDTQIGIGTTIRLLLPTGEDVSAHDPEAELNISQITEGLNGARILIVDDEESIAIFMGDLFESRGGKVTIMTDSQAALALFIQEPTAFDLIITDQTMPQLTGVELAQKILALRPELPVILSSGYSDQVDEAKARALGIRGYITKPMDVDTLFHMVQSLIV